MFENNMLNIFSMCQVQGCGKPLATKPETSTKGFALSVRMTCIARHDFRWNHPSRLLLHAMYLYRQPYLQLATGIPPSWSCVMPRV